MKVFRLVGFTLCACAGAFILGCNENPDGGQAKSPAPSVPGTEKSFVKSGEPPLVIVTPKAVAMINQIIAESGEPPLVTVTPKAVAMINQIIADQGVARKQYLRLRVIPGGCQGFMHKLDLDPDTSAQDYSCESAGVKVVVFNRQKEMLRGAEVDFGEVDGKQGFKIENPNFKGESAKKWLALLEKEKDVR